MSEEYSNGYARGYEAGQQSVLKLAEQPAQQQEPVRSISDEQDAFEKVFKLPEGITRFDGRYAPISYSAWSAQQQCYRWEGWKARAMIAAPQPAQPQQEPVATVKAKIEGGTFVHWTKLPVAGMTLYTSPPASKPLTDEMDKRAAHIEDYSRRDWFITGWLQAEAAHGIKP